MAADGHDHVLGAISAGVLRPRRGRRWWPAPSIVVVEIPASDAQPAGQLAEELVRRADHG